MTTNGQPIACSDCGGTVGTLIKDGDGFKHRDKNECRFHSNIVQRYRVKK